MAKHSAKERQYLREQGYAVESGEHTQRMGRRVWKTDTFGFVDLFAVREAELLLVQVTSWSNMSSRANKIARESWGDGQWATPIRETAEALLQIPGLSIIVAGWHQPEGSGTLWKRRELIITPEELERRSR